MYALGCCIYRNPACSESSGTKNHLSVFTVPSRVQTKLEKQVQGMARGAPRTEVRSQAVHFQRLILTMGSTSRQQARLAAKVVGVQSGF